MFSREMGKEFGQIRYIWSKLIYHEGDLVAKSQIGCEHFFTTETVTH